MLELLHSIIGEKKKGTAHVKKALLEFDFTDLYEQPFKNLKISQTKGLLLNLFCNLDKNVNLYILQNVLTYVTEQKKGGSLETKQGRVKRQIYPGTSGLFL